MIKYEDSKGLPVKRSRYKPGVEVLRWGVCRRTEEAAQVVRIFRIPWWYFFRQSNVFWQTQERNDVSEVVEKISRNLHVAVLWVVPGGNIRVMIGIQAPPIPRDTPVNVIWVGFRVSGTFLG